MKCPIDKDNISLSFLFYLFLKSENTFYRHYLQNEDITTQQIPILLKLLNHEYIYQKEIATDLQMDTGLLTRNIRKLEDNGYVIRQEDNDNRRQNKISLTTKGRTIIVKLRDKGIQREEEIIKNSSVKRQELIELFIDILENSKEYNEKNIGG